MSSKSLLIFLFFFSSTLLTLGQIQELMVQRGYSGELSITEAINGAVLIVYDGNEYFDVVDSENGRQLYRIDKGLGRVLNVVDVAGTQDILVFYESYLMIWSLSEKKEKYLSPKMIKKWVNDFAYSMDRIKLTDRKEKLNTLIFVSGFGEFLVVDLNQYETIAHLKYEIGFYSSYVDHNAHIELLGYDGNIFRWHDDEEKISMVRPVNSSIKSDWDNYRYEGTLNKGDSIDYVVLKKKEKDEILIHPIYTLSDDIKVKGVFINPIKWIKSFYAFNYFNKTLNSGDLFIQSVGDSTLLATQGKNNVNIQRFNYSVIGADCSINEKDTILYLLVVYPPIIRRVSTSNSLMKLMKRENLWVIIDTMSVPDSRNVSIGNYTNRVFLHGISKYFIVDIGGEVTPRIMINPGRINDIELNTDSTISVSFGYLNGRNTFGLMELKSGMIKRHFTFNNNFYIVSNLNNESFISMLRGNERLIFHKHKNRKDWSIPDFIGGSNDYFSKNSNLTLGFNKKVVIVEPVLLSKFYTNIEIESVSTKKVTRVRYWHGPLEEKVPPLIWNDAGSMFYENSFFFNTRLTPKGKILEQNMHNRTFKKLTVFFNDSIHRRGSKRFQLFFTSNYGSSGFTSLQNSTCPDCFYFISKENKLHYLNAKGALIKKPFNVNGFEGMKISPSGRKMVVQRNHEYFLVNESDTIRINHSLPLGCKMYFDSAEKHIVFTKNNGFVLYSIDRNKALYSYLILDSLNWLAYDDDYHYDGTPAAREQLYFTCGLEIIELSQLKDALYVPGLVEKIMSGQPILYPKLSELEICGTLPLIEKLEDAPYHYTITPRKLGLKRVELYINGKRVMMKSPEELNKKEEHYEWNIDEKEIQKFFVPGEENQVKVIGIVQQGNNEMQSRGVVEEVEPTKEEKQHPTFYGLMVGVSDYKDDRLDLKYPTKDSKDLGKVMESAAKKLLNTTTENHVKMFYVNSEVKGENGYSTPEREGVKKALQAISKEARAEDVVMIFFAGHGVMEGDKDKRFTFLTAESTKENLVGISTKDLEEWMSGTNGYLPNKTILIFDACNSGQATEELMAMARDDEETQRIRQVEDLKDKSGMFIMSASAANQSAYELPRYGHGLLTYSLLKTLKTSSSTLDEEKFINVQKWFLETETTMDNLTRELGVKQEAQPFGRGNIRVGELDEEIRGGIEIQQEKPMVYCANALNISTTEDDLHLKEYINQTNTRSAEDQYHFVWGSANAFDIEMNVVYEPVENGYEVKVKWRKKQQTLKSLVFIDQNEKNIKDRILLETESILMMNK